MSDSIMDNRTATRRAAKIVAPGDKKLYAVIPVRPATEIRKAQLNTVDILLEAGATEDEIRDLLQHLGLYQKTGLETS